MINETELLNANAKVQLLEAALRLMPQSQVDEFLKGIEKAGKGAKQWLPQGKELQKDFVELSKWIRQVNRYE